MDNDDITNESKLTAKSNACDVCKKYFKTKSSLNIHKRSHSGDKPYVCDVCKKSFSQKGTLTRHMLVHSGKKEFQWHVCGKYFSQKDDLKTHLIIHTLNAKQFKCDLCDKSFTRKVM